MPYSSSYDPLWDGLVSESLPGNIINANFRGFTTFFSNDVPADIVAQSTAAYYQNKKTVPDVIEVIPGENGQSAQGQSQADKDFEELLNFYSRATPDQIEKAGEAILKTQTIPQSNLCNGFSDENYFGIPFKSFCNSTVDSGKRIALVILGIVLIILGFKFFVSR